MYQTLLARRYLTTKIMPLLAALAVTLCTAMVLITWSVMGGFLRMLTESGRSLIGDVRIVWPNTGFAHYEDLIAELEADPSVVAATPVIDVFGALTLPDGRTEGVLVRGVDGASFARVTNYEDTLWWKPLSEPLRRDREKADPRLRPRAPDDSRPTWAELAENGLRLTRPDYLAHAAAEPALVLGIGVTQYNERTGWGGYEPTTLPIVGADGTVTWQDQFLPLTGELLLRVFPLDSSGRPLESVARTMPVANEFESGLWDIDRRTVLAELSAVQGMLGLDEGVRIVGEIDPIDPLAGGRTETDPARVTTVLVRGRDDVPLVELRDRVRGVYAAFAEARAGRVPRPGVIQIETWEDANRTMIAAVKKETALVLMIFSFISLTAVFLVLSIFWSMISEKTRDIGVLRAVGAGRGGVAAVWLAYGAAIGAVGAILGVALAWAIVTNINEIHDWLGESLGLYVWDPSVYVFKEIPRTLDPVHTVWVLGGGVLSCLVGAAIPAIRAASMDPVRALRFE